MEMYGVFKITLSLLFILKVLITQALTNFEHLKSSINFKEQLSMLISDSFYLTVLYYNVTHLHQLAALHFLLETSSFKFI